MYLYYVNYQLINYISPINIIMLNRGDLDMNDKHTLWTIIQEWIFNLRLVLSDLNNFYYQLDILTYNRVIIDLNTLKQGYF